MEELTSIVVVTHDNLEYTRDCLRGVNQYTPEPYELILVDNGSTDGTVDYLRTVPHAQVLPLGPEPSWATCVNRALNDAIGDFIVLLDPAAYVTAGWLGRLISAQRADPPAGAVGPLTNFTFNNPVQDAGQPYTDLPGVIRHADELAQTNAGQAEVVNKLGLFCFLMSQEAMEKVGTLDENLQVFLEDDYSLRMRLSGFKLKVARDVFVHRSFVTPWTEAQIEADHGRFREKWERVRGQLSQRADELED